MIFNSSLLYSSAANYSGVGGDPTTLNINAIAAVGIGYGPALIARIGLWPVTSKLPMGGWPIFTTPYLRPRPEEKQRRKKAIPLSVEDVFRPAKQPYIPAVENAVATPPRKPTGVPEGVGAMLAQLAAGYPVSGSPGELAAIREALRRNQELIDRLEAERLAGAKQQRTMAALLFLMMEM